MSFSLFDKFDSKAWLARLSALYYDFLHGWTNPVGDPRETIALASASQAGIESGDVEFAMACDLVHFFNAYETASLSQQCNEWGKMAERMKFYGKSSGMSLTLAKRQMMQNLMENRNEDPCVLEGDFLLPSDIASIRTMPLIESWSQMLNGLLCFLFGRYRDAAAYACKGRLMATNSFGPHGGGLAVFLCGLMDVVNAQQENKKLCVRNSFAKRCSKKLCRSAANGEPLNFIGKHYLLEAELAVLHGNVTDAHRLYVAAISTSQKAKLIMQTAIANERAARFLWGLGDHSRAAELFREAIVWYKKWGAVLKVSHLESEVREMGVCLT